MSAVSKIAKEIVKKIPKAATEVAEKTAKEVVPDFASTAISREAKAVAKAAASVGEKNVSLFAAKKAAKTGYQYAAQKNVEVTDAVSAISSFANDMAQRIDAGKATPNQVNKILKKTREEWGAVKTSHAESVGARSGAAQIMQAGAENEDVVLLNEVMGGVEEYLTTGNVRQNLEVLRNIRNKDTLETLGIVKQNMKNRGQEKAFFDNIWHIGKNIMLLQSPINRAADAGANFVMRGISLLDLQVAQALQGAGKKLSGAFNGKQLAEILSSPGIYEGSAARNLNASFLALRDYATQGSRNIGRWIAGRGDDIVETSIGKHAKKMESQYLWQTQNEVANFVLPKDMKDLMIIFKKNPVKTTTRAAGQVLSEGGFALARAADDIPAGAFRAGSLAQDAYQMAYVKAADVGRANDKEFIDKLAKDFILADDGKPISANAVEEYLEYFGPGGFEDAVTSVSKTATKKAEMDTYRVGSLTKVGGTLENMYSDLIHLKYVGKFFDFLYPLARTTIRITDRMFYENPFSSLRRLSKAYKKAAYELETSGATNSSEIYKEAGRFVTGATAYSVAAGLVMNGVLTGDLPESKGERAILERLNRKSNAINLGGFSIPYERYGEPGVMLGTIANIITDLKEIGEKYEDESNTYDIASAAADVIGAFTVDPLWNTIFGRMAEDFSVGKITKRQLKQYSVLLPRAFNSIKADLGFSDDKQVNQFFFDVRKNLLDTKLKMRPKTDMFGYPLEKKYSLNTDKVAKEMADVGANVTMPRVTDSASINGEDISLYPIEKSAWNSFMSHYQVFDSNGEPTGEWTSVDKELFDVIHSGKDATKAGELYYEIGNTELAPDEERLANKKSVLQNVYNEAKRNALLTLLSYKDKYVDNDEEKEYSRIATELYKRSLKRKEKRMKQIPSMDIGE